MVHGQGIQPGAGGIQLAPNQTIISPLTSFPTLQSGLWTTGGLNQQPTQLVTQTGQPIFLRQDNNQTHMFIQTSNNQFQAVPMQMTQGTQQQQSTQGTMQVTPTGQPLVGPSINQQLPIIQTNAAMTPTTIVTQQPNVTAGNNNLLTSAATSQSNLTMSTPVTGMSRQRTIRPNTSSTQTAISTQTAAKQKVSTAGSNTPIGNVPKLAPRNSPVTSTGMQVNTLPRTTLGQAVNLPFSLPKPGEGVSQASKSMPPTTTTLVISNANSKPVPPKVSSLSAATQSTITTVTTSPFSTASTLASTFANSVVATSTVTSLVSNAATGQPNKSSSPLPIGSKLNRKVGEKKDQASTNGIDSKLNISLSTSKPVKGNVINPQRNSTGGLIKPALISTGTNMVTGNHQMINGLMVQIPPNAQMKPPQMSNGGMNKSHLPNGNISKGLQTNNMQKGLPPLKSKPKPKEPENVVLTHVIDGYVIQESPSPFPINGYASATDPDHPTEKNADGSVKSDTKENVHANKPHELVNGQANKDSIGVNGIPRNLVNNDSAKPKLNNGFPEADNSKNKKNKIKKTTPKPPMANSPAQLIVPQLTPKLPTLQPAMPTSNQLIPIQGLSFVNMPQGQPIGTSQPVSALNGSGPGIKRPALPLTKESPMEKRGRVNSPVQNKPDSSQSQANRLPNGQTGTNDAAFSSVPPRETNEPKSEANNVPEAESMWLPCEGKKEPNKWNVQEVYEFIHHLEGCSEFAEDFRTQEIDGQALMLIKEDHIIAILHMKLGPALKICRKIKDLKSLFEM